MQRVHREVPDDRRCEDLAVLKVEKGYQVRALDRVAGHRKALCHTKVGMGRGKWRGARFPAE
jgi:hypothetical protein